MHFLQQMSNLKSGQQPTVIAQKEQSQKAKEDILKSVKAEALQTADTKNKTAENPILMINLTNFS